MRFIPHAIKHMPRLWDGLIVLLGCVLAAGTISLTYPSNVATGLLLLGLVYSCFIEPWIIVTKTLTVGLKTHKQFSIAFLSDFHVGPYKGRRFMRRLVAKTNALRPDLILLGGDFLYNYASDPNLLDPLKELRAPLGVFGAMGNHDSGRDIMKGRITMTKDRTRDVEKVLNECNVTVLHNEWKDIGPVILAGTDDFWMQSYDLGKTLADIPDGKPVVLLTHNPDAITDERTHRADLILSGHTHGGQVRLPLLGSVPPIPNELGRKYDRGTFALPKETTLIVSHGVGESMARPRFLTAPEILCIGIKPSQV